MVFLSILRSTSHWELLRGIHKHAPNPPRSLMASLGREVEKYDQLCDALELHLVRRLFYVILAANMSAIP